MACINCKTEESTYSEYRIINNSGVDIELIPLISNNKDLTKRRLITNGNQIQISGKDFGTFKYSMGDLICNSVQPLTTGVEITFNNSKKIVYEKCVNDMCSNKRNVFDLSFNDTPIETYTITPEDYQNAIDCGGNCN